MNRIPVLYVLHPQNPELLQEKLNVFRFDIFLYLFLNAQIAIGNPDLPVLFGKTDSFVSPRKDKIRNNGCDDRCNNNKCQYDQNKK